MSARSGDGALGEAASLYGVQRRYRDGLGRMRTASDEAVTAVLAALGAELSNPKDVAAAARVRRREVWAQTLDPVLVAWDGQPPVLDLRLPASAADGAAVGVVSSDDDRQLAFTVDLRRARIVRHAQVDGREHLECRVALPLPALPDGEHLLELTAGGTEGRAQLLSAPRACFIPAADRLLGVFLPLYALHSEWSLGIGDLGDLRRLGEFVAGHGATLVGTTPLCAGFNEGPETPSPYLPVSRLAWNELYADLAASPDLAASTEARRLLSEPGVRDAARAMTAEPLVDYARAAALRRPILSALAASVEGRRADALAAFLAERPEVEAYARFRAAREGGGDVAVRDHAYAQWLIDEQLGALAETGAGLYLDLPLGVHPEGFDAQARGGLLRPGPEHRRAPGRPVRRRPGLGLPAPPSRPGALRRLPLSGRLRAPPHAPRRRPPRRSRDGPAPPVRDPGRASRHGRRVPQRPSRGALRRPQPRIRAPRDARGRRGPGNGGGGGA